MHRSVDGKTLLRGSLIALSVLLGTTALTMPLRPAFALSELKDEPGQVPGHVPPLGQAVVRAVVTGQDDRLRVREAGRRRRGHRYGGPCWARVGEDRAAGAGTGRGHERHAEEQRQRPPASHRAASTLASVSASDAGSRS